MEKTYNICNVGSANRDIIQLKVFVPEPGGAAAAQLLLKRENGDVQTLDGGLTTFTLGDLANRMRHVADLMDRLTDAANRQRNAMADIAHWEDGAVVETVTGAKLADENPLTWDIELIPGLGPIKVRSLRAMGYTRIGDIFKADADTIAEVEGIGYKLALKMKGEAYRMHADYEASCMGGLGALFG